MFLVILGYYEVLNTCYKYGYFIFFEQIIVSF